ncbi:autotransporter domain-containing protein [Ancylobacter dichloromethanicus]|uniref:autotransporter domain-containing protein n=2 Tax=Ancylobacter dichloromethanicus TaxID=518825 RepID=UPI0022F2D517|nr:autotransporter domain-containing protein [Ancylobacter dichloromethanicus]MBS7552814.1 autotransporter domain-containing protein [Ancylobacter dichloromethanicus]
MPAVATPPMKTQRQAVRLLRATALSTFLGLGMTILTSPVYAANFNVGSDADLRSAISSAGNGDTITFTANITLTGNLPNVTTNVTFVGGDHTLSGDNQYRGLFVQSGTVAISNLTITGALAQGGSGGSGYRGGGGGGGAGLGGALFVANGAHVTVDNVNLQSSAARGGAGGDGTGSGVVATSGGGGGYWPTGANGGNAGPFSSGGGGTGGGGDGADGGNGGNGGFGGGGGGSGSAYGGSGGFGGGGGGGDGSTMISGGFLAGKGGSGGPTGGGGGGGGGMGGAIFVQDGGTLAVNGPLNVSGNAVSGGAGGSGLGRGEAGGSSGTGMFLAGNGSLVITPADGQTVNISDAIADQTGVGGTGVDAGSWSLVKNGAGTLSLTGANTYSGGTTVNSGVLRGNSLGIQGSILNNAQVIFDQSASGIYAGNMTGTGTLIKTGTGNLTLEGTNTQAGGTRVESGVLFFRDDASLGPTGMAIDLAGGEIGIGTANGQAVDRALTLTGTGGIYVGPNSSTPQAQVTWNGAIGGTGALIVTGGGILELAANNTYTGGTRIVDGNVRFTTDANLGAAGAGIALSSAGVGTTANAVAGLAIDRNLTVTDFGAIYVQNNPLIWSGDISGSGRLGKNGGGVLQLTGTNTYTGGTMIEEGTLQVASDDKLGAAGTDILMVNNGHLWASSSFTTDRSITLIDAGGGFQLDTGTTLTLTGTIGSGGTGAGTLSLVGTGTLILAAAADTYGGINNYGGTIQGNTSNLLGNLSFDNNADNTNARSVVFDQATDGTFAGDITGMGNTLGLGTITKTGAGKLTLTGTSKFQSQIPGLAEFTVQQGILQGTSANLLGDIVNNAALIFDQTFDGTYSGSMSGAGTLTKNGSGKLILTGASTVGGGTTINDGGLAVNGHLTSNVIVNQGSTLSGSGNVTGDITNNGGTIKPGNSIGHLTVDGNFTLNSGTLEMEINAAGDSDRISVVGPDHRVMINAGTLDISAERGIYTPGTTYTIITTEAGGTVTFGDVTGGTAFLTPEVSIDPEHIYVTLALQPGAFRAGGSTINQRAVGGALDAIAAAGGSADLINTVASAQIGQGSAVLQTLSGQPYADFATVNLRASQLFMNTVGRQMSVARGGALGGERASLAEPGSDTLAGLSAWMSGIGSTGSIEGNANASGLDYSLGGTAFGIDYRVNPGFLAGIAGGYVTGSQSVDGFAGDTDADTISVAAYGSFTNGAFYADGLAGYANASNSMDRLVGGASLPSGIARGDTDAGQFIGQIETGYRFDLATSFTAAITPFARLQVISLDQDGFTETGSSPYNLAVASQSTTSVRTTFGADFTASFDPGNGLPLDLGLRLGWVHEFDDTTQAITAAFASAPGADFTVYGAALPRDSALIGLSAAAKLNDSSSIFASYDAEIGGGDDNHQLWGGFKITW